VSIATIRAGLGTNLATLSGLRIATSLPEQVNPPQAVISLQSVAYDGALRGGLTTYTFMLTVLAGRMSERTAQSILDGYISPGAGAIKNAIESDKTLGGSCYDVRVEAMSSVGSLTIGEVNYLAADFTVTVYGN
jgi:hypothetical protein